MLLGVFSALLALPLLSTFLSFLPSTTGPGDGFWFKSTHWPQGASLSSVCHLTSLYTLVGLHFPRDKTQMWRPPIVSPMVPGHISAPPDLSPPVPCHELCVSASVPFLTLFPPPGTPILPHPHPHPPTAWRLPCLLLVAFTTAQPPGPLPFVISRFAAGQAFP